MPHYEGKSRKYSHKPFGRIGGGFRRAGLVFGRAVDAVGKDFKNASDANSPRSKMKRLGFPHTYRHYRRKWSLTGEEVAKLVGLSKMSHWKRETAKQVARNADQKGESSKEQQIVDKELEIVAKKLGKDPKVAQMWVDKVMETLRAGDRFTKGKRVSKEKVGKIVRGTPGLPGEVREYFATVFEGQEQYQEKAEDKGTTQGEIATRIKDLQERGVLKKSDVAEVQKKLGIQEFPSDDTKKSSEPAPRSTWKISPIQPNPMTHVTDIYLYV